MQSDSLILRSTTFAPLTNKGSELTWAEEDGNFTKIYTDLSSQRLSSYISDWDNTKTDYDDNIRNFVTYTGKTWKYVAAIGGAIVTPGTDPLTWSEVFVSDLGHKKDADGFLDYGGDNQVGAQEIREFIDGVTPLVSITLLDNGSPQHKWALKVDSTGALYTEDLGVL